MKVNKLSNVNYQTEPAFSSLRDHFGKIIVELGAEEEKIVVLDADLSSSTKTKHFGAKFPERFFNMGIAEQNMMGVANGLSASGKIPIVSGFTCFSVGRAWEFIRNAAYDKANIKICTTHAGLSAGRDGGSHQAIEDLALIGTIPGTTIYCPCDPYEVELMLRNMILIPGIVYMRLMRNHLPWIYKSIDKVPNNFITTIYESSTDKVKLTIFSMGSMSSHTPKLIKPLEKDGFTIRIVHFGIVKPLPKEIIKDLCSKTDLIVSLEEHNIVAGFGAQISRIIALYNPLPLMTIGIEDQFGQSGSVSELYREYGLDISSILEKISLSTKNLNSK
jgi:transketolase